MNLLDVLLLTAMIVAAVGGWKAGFLARITSWLGIGLGLYVGVRILPTVLEAFEVPTVSARMLIVVTVLVVVIFIGQALGLIAGHRIRSVLPMGGARTADRFVGSFAGVIGVLVGVWLLLPMLADVHEWTSRAARGSLLARAVNGSFPDPPSASGVVGRLIDERASQRVFGGLKPSPDAGQPPVDPGLDPAVVERVKASTVKIQGEACKRIQEGSGFVIAEDVIITNAHVVAGEESVDVVRPDGRRLKATVAVFNSAKDIAVLRVARLGLTPVTRAKARSGDTGAVFGHPGGQADVRAAPARISAEVTAQGEDIYGHETERQVFILAANLQPGDSGGPLVDKQGRAVGVAFAIAPDKPGTAYALTGGELDAVMRTYGANPNARADTQSCLA